MSELSRTTPFNKVRLYDMEFSSVAQAPLVDYILAEVAAGRGGWIVTANLDILLRYSRDALARQVYDEADLVVADGMPLVWASRLQGEPLPERVAGSALVGALAAACRDAGPSILLLGGAPGSAEGAAARFLAEHPGLRIHGDSSPRCSPIPSSSEVAAMAKLCTEVDSDIVLLGLGSPKQEYAISRLRRLFPKKWFIGVGVSFSFATGELRRAPEFLQTLGLEWVHRLAQEPRHLAKRYLVDDVPFVGRVMFRAARSRFSRNGSALVEGNAVQKLRP